MRALFVYSVMACAWMASAQAKPLVADISNPLIDLHAAFSGTDVLLFGARNEPGDIVVVVRGPTSNVTVREKQRIAGMWMFVRKAKYDELPAFFAVASTRPLRQLGADALLERLSITPHTAIRDQRTNPNADVVFDKAVLRIREGEKLYTPKPVPIEFFGETLFKTRIHFPDTMPEGSYQAEVYLIEDGTLRAAQILPLNAVKTGVEAQIFQLSREAPFLYGLCSVMVALAFGWFAHRIFRKR